MLQIATTPQMMRYTRLRITSYNVCYTKLLRSVYFVGKTVGKWSISVIISFLAGTAAAIVISILNPATENDSLVYLIRNNFV